MVGPSNTPQETQKQTKKEEKPLECRKCGRSTYNWRCDCASWNDPYHREFAYLNPSHSGNQHRAWMDSMKYNELPEQSKIVEAQKTERANAKKEERKKESEKSSCILM